MTLMPAKAKTAMLAKTTAGANKGHAQAYGHKEMCWTTSLRRSKDI
jgi:hypothetical protein